MNTFNSKKRGAETSAQEAYGNLSHDLKKTKVTPANVRGGAKKDDKKSSKAAPWHQNQQFLTKFIPMKKQFSLGTGVINTENLVISSWNINGLRAITTKNDLQNYFNKRMPDILCLSETKTTQESIDAEQLVKWVPAEYTCYFNCSKVKKGYAGTAIITKYRPLAVEYGMGFEKFDAEGRVITAEFEKFTLVSCYVPMCGDDFCKLDMRIDEWDANFHKYLAKLREKGKPLIVCGDLNVVHQDIDVWGDMGKYAGSSDRERENFAKLLGTGFIDSFRYLHPEVRKYSWWSTYLSHRPINKGRRYDYILVTKDGLNGIKEAYIDNDAYGSDHCPVEMIYNPNFDPSASPPVRQLDAIPEEKKEGIEEVEVTKAESEAGTKISVEKVEVVKESEEIITEDGGK